MAGTITTGGVRAIAVFKICKGTLLLCLGFGLLALTPGDLAGFLEQVGHALHVDPENRYLNAVLAKVTGISPATLTNLSAGTLFYSMLTLTEGVGLWMGFRWAAYLTIVATGAFIPLEVNELYRRATVTKGLVLVVNVIIVGYLARTVVRHAGRLRRH